MACKVARNRAEIKGDINHFLECRKELNGSSQNTPYFEITPVRVWPFDSIPLIFWFCRYSESAQY